MGLKILILGVNGFIGNSLTEYIVKNKDWEVYGMDMAADKLDRCLGHERFHFVEGDITINKEWIEYHVKKCDVVIPLVAIATPATYVLDPLRVFELDFEANLDIVRKCVRYKKRVLFPSTSEVYGDPEVHPQPETYWGHVNPIGARSVYDEGKRLAEALAVRFDTAWNPEYGRPYTQIGRPRDAPWASWEFTHIARIQCWYEDFLAGLARPHAAARLLSLWRLAPGPAGDAAQPVALDGGPHASRMVLRM